MAPRDHIDRSLDRLLADLGARLTASGGKAVLVDADNDQASAEAIAVFCALGLLSPSTPSGAVICDGCDRGCTMEVEYSASGTDAARAFIVCDKRDDIGQVPVEVDRLQQWRFEFGSISKSVANLLGSEMSVHVPTAALFRDLGVIAIGGLEIEVRLSIGVSEDRSFPGLTIVMDPLSGSSGFNVVSLGTLCRFKGRLLSLNKAALRRVLNTRFDDPRIAWEIRFEGAEIVLINRVTGQASVIARPNLNSSNDNAFQYLYDHPGETLSLSTLRNAIDDRSIADLHKIVENLNFRGPLKDAFFRVSKNAICFERFASMGKLAILRIDPKTPF